MHTIEWAPGKKDSSINHVEISCGNHVTVDTDKYSWSSLYAVLLLTRVSFLNIAIVGSWRTHTMRKQKKSGPPSLALH
jgi:hypothetical protein